MNAQEKLAKLNQLLEHSKNAPYYQKRLPDHPLRSLAELKSLPLTTKDDLRKESPFGLIAVPQAELFQYHESFGTTGVPVSVWLTKEDYLDHARELKDWGVDFQPDDVVLIRFPYSISAAAHIVHGVAVSKQSCVVAAGARSSVSPFPRIIQLLQKLNVTKLTCLPLQVLLIAETAEMLGFQPNRDFPHLKAIGTAGEPLSPARRRLLEDIWGVPLFDHYGMTEIGPAIVDCRFGRPHPVDDCFIFELLRNDLQSEVAPGEMGYLVVTTLCRRGTPMIRYLTGDRAKLLNEVCPCGKNTILEVHGRQEHTFTVGDRVLDTWDLEDIVAHLPYRRFWVVGPAPQGLHFIVEQEKMANTDMIPPGMIHDLEEKYQVKLHFEIVPKGTLYDRSELMNVGTVGKPQYIYSAREIEQKAYLKSAKI
jgi:phenylacetate-CoA ligase